jgi:nuclear protein localization family protein 4
MIIRVSSRQGVQRLEIDENSTIAQLKSKISQLLSVPTNDMKLSIRLGPKVTDLSNDASTLKSLNVMNGDMVHVISAAIQDAPSEPAPMEEEKEKVTHAQSVNGNKVVPVKEPSKPKVPEVAPKDVVEDTIDQELAKTDGWTPQKKGPHCNHGDKGSCINCMPIAPWDILNKEPWKSQGIKFLPFHSFFKNKHYNNPQYTLDVPKYSIDVNSSAAYTSKESRTVSLDSQPYRHVDHIEFEHSSMVEQFIQYWRETGNQRCGYLYGSYVPDPTIPLGIRALVAAVYEPPQKSNRETVALLKDPNEDKVNEFAKSLGMQRIGFIWSSLKVDEKKQIVPDRDENVYVLKSIEMMRMAQLQNRYPSPFKKSTAGYFGSKFVSVLVHGNKEGHIDVAAYQVSNQCAGLVRDGVIKAAKDPEFFRVRKSTNETLFPDIYYRRKNEYGFNVQTKAEPNFPTDFFVISVRHSFPKDPRPRFQKFTFPIENRPHRPQSARDVQKQLEGQHGTAFFDSLTDFHLLLFLLFNLPQDVYEKIIYGIKERGKLFDRDVRPAIEQWINKQLGGSAAPTAATNTPSNTGAAAPNNNSNTGGPKNPREQEMREQLLLMGYSEQQANEALWATNYGSLEQAIEFLLNKM